MGTIELLKQLASENCNIREENGNIIIEPKVKEYKPEHGDFVRLVDRNRCVFIYNTNGKYTTSFIAGVRSIGDYYKDINNTKNMLCNAKIEPATQEDIDRLISVMNENGDDWDFVNKKIIPYKYQPKAKELVWCSNDGWNNMAILKYYDVVNNNTFRLDGKRSSIRYDNYAPFKGELPPNMVGSFEKLED